MSSKDKIQKAREKLILEEPYFGTVATTLKLKESYDIKSFESNGKNLIYNPDYIDIVDSEDIEFMLANGAMHSILKHNNRVGSRYVKLWQLATDLTINSILVKNGLSLPLDANFEDRFDGFYAEEVYEILYSEIKDEELSDDETFDDKRSDEVQEEIVEDIDELEFLEQLLDKMSRQGTLPKDLKLLIPEYFSNKIDWRDILYRYIASYAKSTFSFMPPNKKYLYRGIYLPALSSDLLRIVIAIDTSGSVDEKLLSIFLSEVQSITQQYPNYEIDIITADSKIQSHEVFLAGENLNYEITGRGGTDFNIVFEYIDRYVDYPTILLYFTDGYGTFPNSEPSYDTAWITTNDIEVPFGEKIVLDII